jgi:hypothetical protein
MTASPDEYGEREWSMRTWNTKHTTLISTAHAHAVLHIQTMRGNADSSVRQIT